MNTIEYVATECSPMTGPNGHYLYGEIARVFVNGEWRFSVMTRDKWDRMCHVVILTRADDNGNTQSASAHFLPSLLDDNLTELAQLFPPF